MNKQEFDARIGRESSQEEFDQANEVYMTVSIDKDIFCEMWKELRDDAKRYMVLMARTMKEQHTRQMGVYYENAKLFQERSVELDATKDILKVVLNAFKDTPKGRVFMSITKDIL